MGEGKKQMAKSPCSLYAGHGKNHDEDQWTLMGEDYDHEASIDNATSSSSASSLLGDSTVSNGSSSSEMADDASSSSTNTSSSSLYDLSELMAQLPIKRGLSKFYQGKSQSFTTLSRVSSIEDLPKKETLSIRRKMIKASKSYGGGLDSYKSSYTLVPKPTISKKASRGSFSSLSYQSRKLGSFVSSCRPPMVPPQKNLAC